MAQVCEVTNRRPMAGNNVSHANNKTRRRFELNIRMKRFFSSELNRWVKLKVSAKGQRLIDKYGIDAVLAKMKLAKQANKTK